MTGSESISRTHWHAFNSSMNLHVAASVTCAFGNLWHPVLNKEYPWLFSFWACNIGAIANLPTGLMSFVTRTDTFPSFFLFLFFFCFVETHLYKDGNPMHSTIIISAQKSFRRWHNRLGAARHFQACWFGIWFQLKAEERNFVRLNLTHFWRDLELSHLVSRIWRSFRRLRTHYAINWISESRRIISWLQVKKKEETPQSQYTV